MTRFFIQEDQVKNEVATIVGPDARHISKVLRYQPGQELILVWRQQAWMGQILQISENRVEIAMCHPLEENKEAPLAMYLLQGIAKGEKMDFIIQKSVELGVIAFIPVSCHYSVVQLTGKKAQERRNRWQKIAESAAKQCGRLTIPEIYPVSSMAEALSYLPEDCRIIMAWEKTEDLSLATALDGEKPAAAALIIGPEGGLTFEEALLAKEKGASLVSLGKRILRTETAALAALSIIMYRWGDVGVD